MPRSSSRFPDQSPAPDVRSLSDPSSTMPPLTPSPAEDQKPPPHPEQNERPPDSREEGFEDRLGPEAIPCGGRSDPCSRCRGGAGGGGGWELDLNRRGHDEGTGRFRFNGWSDGLGGGRGWLGVRDPISREEEIPMAPALIPYADQDHVFPIREEPGIPCGQHRGSIRADRTALNQPAPFPGEVARIQDGHIIFGEIRMGGNPDDIHGAPDRLISRGRDHLGLEIALRPGPIEPPQPGKADQRQPDPPPCRPPEARKTTGGPLPPELPWHRIYPLHPWSPQAAQ